MGYVSFKTKGGKIVKFKTKSKSNPHKKRKKSSNPSRSKIKRRKRTMPKRKKVSRKRGSASILGINTGKALAAGLYGAVRARMSNFLAPYTRIIPAGAVTDEVGMVIALQVIKKFALRKAGVLRDAATVGQGIEFARIGEAVATGQLNLGSLGAAPSNASGFYTVPA